MLHEPCKQGLVAIMDAMRPPLVGDHHQRRLGAQRARGCGGIHIHFQPGNIKQLLHHRLAERRVAPVEHHAASDLSLVLCGQKPDVISDQMEQRLALRKALHGNTVRNPPLRVAKDLLADPSICPPPLPPVQILFSSLDHWMFEC